MSGARARVTLVAPPSDFLHHLYGFRGRGSYRNQLPLGLGYLAAAVRAQGMAVQILDAAAHGWDGPTTLERVLETEPDVIGISAITLEAPRAYGLAAALRPRTDAWLVLGGAHANACHDMIPDECTAFDALAVGDGEPTLVELCQAREHGDTLAGIAGLRARRPDGTYGALIERPVIPDLDTLLPPAFDLFRHELYRPLPHRRRRLPASCLITSRGCSFARCTYCEMSHAVRRTYRRHSAARVVSDVKALVAVTHAREIYFQDDIFITDPAWVQELCERLVHERLDLIWSCESRFGGVTAELLTHMRRAGCWRIYYGLESGDQALLDRIHKGFTLAEARAAVNLARAAGLEVVGFFMLGLPGETPQKAESTIAYSLSLGLDHAVYSLTVPHRGTELYDICSTEGQVLRERGYEAKRASYLPAAYRSAAQLEQLRRRAFRRFYLRPVYWWQCLRRIRSFADLRYYAEGLLGLLRFIE